MVNEVFEIEGGRKLQGSIIPQGAKNEALQVICGTLLTAEKVTISNLPDILDVNRLIEILRLLGSTIEKVDEHTYTFEANNIDIEVMAKDAYQNLARQIRGSVMIMGPLLARFKTALIPKPGGDKIGRRRMDTHFLGFIDLGVKFNYNAQKGIYKVDAGNLTGKYMHLDEPSVTGTANVVMAAALAKGETVIYNAACEPYLQQLCSMLVSMGANIEGIGSNKLRITGVDELNGCTHRCLSDMIEIGSFIGLAAITQSEITIKNAGIAHLGNIPKTFQKLGIQMEFQGDDIYLPPNQNYEVQNFIDGSILSIYDAPWPGFTPDLISIILVTAIQVKGSVLIHQKMFESRLFFVDKLIDMGAQIILCDPHRATVIGLERKMALRGIKMSSPDIRAGVALLIAALSAKGTSIISNIFQIDRGYQQIDQRLNALGANIVRKKV